MAKQRKPKQGGRSASKKPVRLAPDRERVLQHALGLFQQGHIAEAVAMLRELHGEAPGHPLVNYLLGMAAAGNAELDDATGHFEAAVRASPGNPGFHFALGDLHARRESFAAAAKAFRAAIRLDATLTDAVGALGLVLYKDGRYREAQPVFEEAIRQAPAVCRHYMNAAANALAQGDEVTARGFLDRAQDRMDQASVSDLADLGRMYQRLYQSRTAQGIYQRALAHGTRDHALMESLARSYAMSHEVDRAVDLFREAAQVRGERVEQADIRIGSALGQAGLVAEAMPFFDAAFAASPDDFDLRSDRLLYRNYLPDVTPADLFAAHTDAGRCLPPASARAFRRDCDPARPLRIGYVSGDLRKHSVGYFIEPVLQHHDARRCQVFCYSNAAQEDAVSQRLRRHVHRWRRIHGMEAGAVAALIASDDVDILVDLSGHTNAHRLDVFGLKPAPIQVTWLGYPNTTGLVQMDYRITDEVADPKGLTEQWHTEHLVRLPRVFSCYVPPADAPQVAPPPLRTNGFPTFGCFNNANKLNDRVLAVWARLLCATPSARLVLKCASLQNEATRTRFSRFFQDHGVDPTRIELLARDASTSEHLARYGTLDIALDPFPYCGTTTSCEALWMGVPLVSLAGSDHRSRVGASQLTALGMPELVAPDEASYVRIASELAGDVDRLAGYRAELRSRFSASPLMDHQGFTRELEEAYKTMWQTWCADHAM